MHILWFSDDLLHSVLLGNLHGVLCHHPDWQLLLRVLYCPRYSDSLDLFQEIDIGDSLNPVTNVLVDLVLKQPRYGVQQLVVQLVVDHILALILLIYVPGPVLL